MKKDGALNGTRDHSPEGDGRAETHQAAAFELRKEDRLTRGMESQVHVIGPGIICDTESRGHATPSGSSKEKIVLEASEGFIPLWAEQTTLRWRFQPRSLAHFASPEAAKREIRTLLGEALLEWGNAVPVRFTENEDLWDFEIVTKRNDECNGSGCVLASAFFPDAGRHEFVIYPRMFTQSRKEQIDTFIHEIGHIFALRHFFTNVSEKAFPVEIFGTHDKFTIMNYGELSELTSADRDDLVRLYQQARSGALKQINGTPIRLVRPYHTLSLAPDSVFATRQLQPALQAQFSAAYVAGLG